MPCSCTPHPQLSTSAKIYAAAEKYLGTKEVPGKGSNPLIKSWIKQAAEWLDGDDSATAWCGCFRGHLGMQTGTGVVTAHYRAANWAKWGKAVNLQRPDLWQRGDTLVMTRTGGNHVCLYHGPDPKNKARILCLGGNQSDAVTIASFPISRITSVRR